MLTPDEKKRICLYWRGPYLKDYDFQKYVDGVKTGLWSDNNLLANIAIAANSALKVEGFERSDVEIKDLARNFYSSLRK